MPVHTANDLPIVPTRPPWSRLIAGFVIAGAPFGAASSWAGTTTWSIIDFSVDQAPANAAVNGHGSSECGPPRRN